MSDHQSSKEARKQRLSSKLRDNLFKRKQQQRARLQNKESITQQDTQIINDRPQSNFKTTDNP